jgi:hypothetical protein
MHTLNWGPLIVVPTSSIEEMIRYCDPLTQIANYDRRLSRYWEIGRHLPVWYTWPSLVDHRDGPSLIPGRSGAHHRAGVGSRIARKFLEGSALEAEWDGPVVDENFFGRYAGRECVTYQHVGGKRLTVPVESYRSKCLRSNHLWERVT